jgi:protoheme IX farnesyltransferase
MAEQLLRGALFGFLGIWLAASSAAAINQLLDARIDAKMARTSWRPLVQGQVKPWQALAFALVLARCRWRCWCCGSTRSPPS